MANVMIEKTDSQSEATESIQEECYSNIATSSHNKFKQYFKHLGPADEADPTGIYSAALDYAIEDNSIKNIAITGPYGAGKSSVIRTYKNKSNDKFLNISLAGFKEDSDKEGVREAEEKEIRIERSILQQMLYSASAAELPHSRFKRIFVPNEKQALLTAFCFVLWLLSSIYWLKRQDGLPEYQMFSVWDGLVAFCISTLGAVIIFWKLYLVIRPSITKITVANTEVELGAAEHSILNKYLDEIIYFFQVKEYKVVVFEDLDRLRSDAIFVKLREINHLINNARPSSSPIKFLYALKDDVFKSKDRTKFFDFVIPIVPVINASNSIDKFKELLKIENIEDKFDTSFIREVSLYLNDYRLLQNIINELLIYFDKLNSEKLDANKLLAMMIYKNFYPEDFEKLHDQSGALYSICNEKLNFINQIKTKNDTEIENLHNFIAEFEDSIIENYAQFRKMVIGQILVSSQYGISYIEIYGNQYLFNDMEKIEWESVSWDEKIYLYTHSNGGDWHKFSSLMSNFFSREKLERIIKKIRNGSEGSVEEAKKKIKKLNDLNQKITHQSLSDLMNLNQIAKQKINEIVNKHFDEKSMLLMYLISNGYLSEDYHTYISNFYEGRLTHNDREYLMMIRGGKVPAPDHTLDNLEEVYANMRTTDFEEKFFLNVRLVDHLLQHWEFSNSRKFILENFNDIENFFDIYWRDGLEVEKFVTEMLDFSPSQYILSAGKSSRGSEHMVRVLAYAKIPHLMLERDFVADYVVKNITDLVDSPIFNQINLEVFEKLKTEFEDVTIFSEIDGFVDHIHEHDLYAINENNVTYILDRYSKNRTSEELSIVNANYTSVLEYGSENLKSYIESNLINYINNVLLLLEEDNHEKNEHIEKILLNEKIDHETKKLVINEKNCIFDEIEKFDEELWQCFWESKKVVITWENLAVFFNQGNEPVSEEIREFLTSIFNVSGIVDELKKIKISNTNVDKSLSGKISWFILSNVNIDDTRYVELVKSLYEHENFPVSLSDSKKKILAKNTNVRLSSKSYEIAKKDDELLSLLIFKSLEKYWENESQYPINNKVRKLLLSYNLREDQKIRIVKDIDPEDNNNEIFQKASEIVIGNHFEPSLLEPLLLKKIIISADDINNVMPLFSRAIKYLEKQTVVDILKKFGEPWSEITENGKRPKIKNTEESVLFVSKLKESNWISSFSYEKDEIRINTFKNS